MSPPTKPLRTAAITMTKLFLFVLIFSSSLASAQRETTLANVCRTGLISDPGCRQHCIECGNSKSKAAQQMASITQGIGGVNSGVSFATTVSSVVGKVPAIQALAIHNCVVSVVQSATTLMEGCMNEDCMTSTSVPMMASKAQAVCVAAECLAAYKPELMANPYYGALVTTCSLGNTLATHMTCGDYTFRTRFLSLQGATAACRASIAAASPLESEDCPANLSNVTVAACQGRAVRSESDIQNDCSARIHAYGVRGTAIGACAGLCADKTIANSKRCL